MADSVLELAQRVSEPSDPRAALLALTELRGRLAELEEYHVETALARGASWSEIGRALGISKQAAHKRFAERLRRQAGREGRWMTVTGTARLAVQLGRRAAAAGGRRTVAPEHLLLGLMALPGGTAARALAEAGVQADRVRAQLGVPPRAAADGDAEVSSRSRAVLERALDEAVRLGHLELTDVHLLLALLHHGGPGVRELLRRAGTTPEAVQALVETPT